MLCLLTSCQCEKYFTSTVPVLFICCRYISLQVTVYVTVFVLPTRISLLCHFHHLNYRLFMRLQWPPYPRKTYFLVTNLYQLGDAWNFLLIHRENLYYVCDSTCIIVLHKPSLMSVIPPQKVNIHKTTKFAQTHYIQNKHSITKFIMVCLIFSAIQKSPFSCSSSQCIWDCCFSLACYNSARYCYPTRGFLLSPLFPLTHLTSFNLSVLDCRHSSSHCAYELQVSLWIVLH